ncbi:hypothetical protein AF332_08735 [Sporosarcina globispora]|uniref:Uncharacterized protein n=1 Tax=Sporosarcina globispora TaxID=1459 RepID=A0A0M0GBI2_SPOGL|nr:hypothetical protein [Sporosarcina globispora]KON86882.1 hypothetical protein AF332_08735 [Sporosarcina globispora]
MLKNFAVQVLNAAKLYSATNNITDETALSNAKGELKQYLDNAPDEYSLTIDVGTGNKYTYTNIMVKKDGKTKTFLTEEDVLDGKESTE